MVPVPDCACTQLGKILGSKTSGHANHKPTSEGSGLPSQWWIDATDPESLGMHFSMQSGYPHRGLMDFIPGYAIIKSEVVRIRIPDKVVSDSALVC